MATFQYKNGIGTTSAYQVSARPYLLRGSTTGGATIDRVDFTNVTRFIQFSASAELKIGFSDAGMRDTGADLNYFVQSKGVSEIFEWKVRSVFLSGSSGATNYEIRAGVTSIDQLDLATNWSSSAGIG